MRFAIAILLTACFALAQFRATPFVLADNATPPVTQSAQPSVVETTVVLQTGQQVNINPWFFSPFVFTVQGNILIKQDGRAPFLISPGLQLFQNQIGSPSGACRDRPSSRWGRPAY